MPLLVLMMLGAVAGYLASRAMGMRVDAVTALALGFFGALVGAMGLRILYTVVHGAFVLAAAVGGAVLVIWLWRVFVEKR